VSTLATALCAILRGTRWRAVFRNSARTSPTSPTKRFSISYVARWTIGLGLVLSVLAIPILAVPPLTWRTGRIPAAPLQLQQSGPPVSMSNRLWIDTDAACGVGGRTDVDDCFALALLIRERAQDIAGISTVFGNAEQASTHKKVLGLLDTMRSEGIGPVPVHSGSANPGDAGTPALAALRDALAQGPLTIISLGPLTNIAGALADRPGLHPNVSRLVAVMGRRPGHLFHPSEGSGRGTFLGHGPIFRDFNFAKDSNAAAEVLAMRLPITLIPYDVGRRVVLTARDLERIGQSGPTMSWISAQSHSWLMFWRREIGADGFSPFDLVAAVYLLDPALFNCARVRVVVGVDRALWTSRFWTTKALLVEAGENSSSVIYCPDAASGLNSRLVDLLTTKRL
jgi:purine nucleosidase